MFRYLHRRPSIPNNEIPAATHHAKTNCVLVLDAIDEDVLAHCKTPKAGSQVLVAGAISKLPLLDAT
ncbi:MAG TPA: hypothetical protein VIX89_20395 [Bryobacteraceae bacterium]